jgi:hypothetical protein
LAKNTEEGGNLKVIDFKLCLRPIGGEALKKAMTCLL